MFIKILKACVLPIYIAIRRLRSNLANPNELFDGDDALLKDPKLRKLSNFFMRPGVRAALASYILMVSVVYHVMIVPYWNPQGFTWLTATGLNTVMPILYIIDWLVFAEKRPIFYKNLPYWLIFPAVYGATSIIRGLLTNVYPYPFLNVADLGIGNVLLNMSGLVAVFAVVGPIFIAVGHLISDRTKNL